MSLLDRKGLKQKDASYRGAGREGARHEASRSRCVCGATGIRTQDLLHAMQALYQLSYGPWPVGRVSESVVF